MVVTGPPTPADAAEAVTLVVVNIFLVVFFFLLYLVSFYLFLLGFCEMRRKNTEGEK